METKNIITTSLMCFSILLWMFYGFFKIPICIPITGIMLQVFWLIIILKNKANAR